LFQPLDPAIMNKLDNNIKRFPKQHDFWLNIKKRYVRTGAGCGLCSDGALWFDLQFEVK